MLTVGQGFVDLQINGLAGIDFSAPGLTMDLVRSVTEQLIARGTAAYCPTVCTGSLEVYKENLGVLAKAMDEPDLTGRLLGIHLEGPFISPEPGACGAHDTRYIREPNIGIFDQLWGWAQGKVALMTLAPERPDAEELIRHATNLGVKVMLGHHLADNESLEKAVAAGASGSTHLGNGLPNEIHRHANPLWWQLACDDLLGTFITDGHHLPAAFIKVALRAKSIGRFVVISDAAPLAGMPPGSYELFGKPVQVEASGRISCHDGGYLAGSGSTMIECVNYLASLKLLTEDNLWKVSVENPLKLLGKTPDALSELPSPIVGFDGIKFEVEE